jgi:glycosyltransferase involved in cell wall biosynthesis
MSIALVTNYLPPYRMPLYALLAERYGVEVHCFGGEAHYVPESLRDLDRQIAAAPFPAHRMARQGDARTLAEHSDAVIVALTGRVAVPSAWRGARRSDTPFVLWASLWRHPLTLAHQLSYPLMRRIYRRSDAVLTYGPHVSRYVARIRRNERNVIVAPQAVEPEVFGREVTDAETGAWRADLGIGPETPIVLFAGRLVREKGADVLVDAWRRLGRSDAALVLAGTGPLLEDLRRDAPAGVVFAGSVPRERLAAAYAASEFLVVPSVATRRFLEPWGLVCNEAMMQSRPVIGSVAVGAVIGGLVTHGGTGLAVRAGDSRDLAQSIDRLLDDEPLRRRLGRLAGVSVADYSYDRAADAFGEALAAVGALDTAGHD